MRTKSPTFRSALAATLLALAATSVSACANSPENPSDPAATASDVASATEGAQPSEPVSGTTEAKLPDPAPNTTGDLAARVNGIDISLETFRVQAFTAMTHWVNQGLDPGSADGQAQLQAIRHQVLDDIINQTLIDEYAATHSITVTDAEVDESIAAYQDEMGGPDAFEKYLTDAQTTLEQVREMERRSLVGKKVVSTVVGDVPAKAPHRHARQILCDTRDACEAAHDRIVAGELFETVAKETSKDPTSAARGGDLDWVAKGMLPGPKFEEALFALDEGELSGVVESEFGFHVIEVLEVDPNRALDEQQQFNLHEKMFMDWVAQLREQSEIAILIPDLADPESR